MHAEYNALVISAVCFSFIELIASLLSVSAMRRLKVIRILRRYNDLGVEVDEEGKVIQKKVNIKRLVLLAKPVSLYNTTKIAVVLWYGTVGICRQVSFHTITFVLVQCKPILLMIWDIDFCY